MKDFILRNIERVFSLLLTGIFLALLFLEMRKVCISGLTVAVRVVIWAW